MPFPNIGPGELILILIIALVVLGPGKLPDVAQSLGKSVREFRRAATDVTEAGKLDAPAPPPASSVAHPTAATPAPVAPAAPTAPSDPVAGGMDSVSGDADRPSGTVPNAAERARDPNLS